MGHLPLWWQHRRQRLHCAVQGHSARTQLVPPVCVCVCVCKYTCPHIHDHLYSCAPVCVFSESCSREEFMCDSGRCLLPVSVCDGHPNCHDQTDEANCSHKHKGENYSCYNCPFHRIADYSNQRKLVAVVLIVSLFMHKHQTFGSIFLNIRSCCLYLLYMIINKESLGCVKLWWAFLIHLIDQWINHGNNQQINENSHLLQP